MNSPFVCKSIANGVVCGQPAAKVYATATTTRLVCDDCAAALGSAKGLIVNPPIADVCLLELLPAREALLKENDRLSRLNDKASRLIGAAVAEQNHFEKICGFVVLVVSVGVLAAWILISSVAAILVGGLLAPGFAFAR